jgi:hypothetical protein
MSMSEPEKGSPRLYLGPERRGAERRSGKDRRQTVRWEPARPDRREKGIGVDRRRTGNVWRTAPLR